MICTLREVNNEQVACLYATLTLFGSRNINANDDNCSVSLVEQNEEEFREHEHL